jgi:hypothetical protein
MIHARTIRRMPRFCQFTWTAALCALVPAAPGNAQKPLEAAPPDVTAAVTQRGWSFLREVARLSPMPPGTDPDRAQALPRAETYTYHYTDGREMVRRRAPGVRVMGDLRSGRHQQGRAWTGKFFDDIDVSVDTASGYVTDFMDRALSEALSADPAPDRAHWLTRDRALMRAARYLHAAGVPSQEFVFKDYGIHDIGQPDASSRQAMLSLARIWSGVPYQSGEGQATFIMDAQYGRLIGYGAQVGALPPKSDRLAISYQRAVQIAREFVTKKGEIVVGGSDGDLRVMLPNDHWAKQGKYVVTTSPQAHLTWAIGTRVKAQLSFSDRRTIYVHVDATTGEVVGGEARDYPQDDRISTDVSAFRARLHTATRLVLAPIQGGGASKALSLDATPLPFYGVLSSFWDTDLPGRDEFTASHKLSVTFSDGGKADFEYDLTHNLLRGSNDGKPVMATMGICFAAWVDDAWARANARL